MIYCSTRKSAPPKGANLAVSIDSFFCFLCSFSFFSLPTVIAHIDSPEGSLCKALESFESDSP